MWRPQLPLDAGHRLRQGGSGERSGAAGAHQGAFGGEGRELPLVQLVALGGTVLARHQQALGRRFQRGASHTPGRISRHDQPRRGSHPVRGPAAQLRYAYGDESPQK